MASNQLRSFSLIEPRYQMYAGPTDLYKAPTSNHPGSSSPFDPKVPISISCGERMLAQVFQALAANPALFAKTLLDCHLRRARRPLPDHVTPPCGGVSCLPKPAVNNPNYNSYVGARPALFINPYVRTGELPPHR